MDFKEKVKLENERIVNELLSENEQLDFYVIGWNMDAIYASAAVVGVGLFVPVAYAAGVLMSDKVERTRIHFTDKGLIVLNLNKFSQAVSSYKILYKNIKSSNLYLKNATLEVISNDEHKLAVEFEDVWIEKFSHRMREKLMFEVLEEEYTSGAHTAYKAAVAAGIALATYEGASLINDYFKTN